MIETQAQYSDAPPIGILLFNLGGPDSLEAVQPFLYNLFSDNDIIQIPVPAFLQRLLAWRISNKRKKESQENYNNIGGKSPILDFTKAQAEALEQTLLKRGIQAKTYIAMRYWHPRCEEALTRIKQDGIKHLILLPLYPHYSLATTGSSLREFERLRKATNTQPWQQISTVCAYYDDPTYLQALAETIQQAMTEQAWSCPNEGIHVVFSAHGLPQGYVKKNRDPYPKQIQQTAALTMAKYFPANSWQICYQSKVGPLKWLQPYTEDLLPHLAKQGKDNVLVVPISFVSDHIETLFELDLLYLPDARELGMRHIHRAPALNYSQTYVEALANLTQRAIDDPNPCRLRLPDDWKYAEAAYWEPKTTCSPTSINDLETKPAANETAKEALA